MWISKVISELEDSADGSWQNGKKKLNPPIPTSRERTNAISISMKINVWQTSYNNLIRLVKHKYIHRKTFRSQNPHCFTVNMLIHKHLCLPRWLQIETCLKKAKWSPRNQPGLHIYQLKWLKRHMSALQIWHLAKRYSMCMFSSTPEFKFFCKFVCEHESQKNTFENSDLCSKLRFSLNNFTQIFIWSSL